MRLIPLKDVNNKIISINNNGNHNKMFRNKYITDNYLIGNKKIKLNGKKGKEKINLLADIIMKINSEDYFYDIFLTDKLMSNNISDDFLDSVQKSINDIEKFKKKEKNKNRKERLSKESMVNLNNKRKKIKINTNNSFMIVIS